MGNRTWLLVAALVFLACDPVWGQVGAAQAQQAHILAQQPEAHNQLGHTEFTRIHALNNLLNRFKPLRFVMRYMADKPHVANGIIRAANGTLPLQLANNITGVQIQELVSISADKKFQEPMFESLYFLLTFGMIIVMVSIWMIANPKQVVQFIAYLDGAFLGHAENMVNLDMLPPAVARWPEWEGVKFKHSFRTGHLVSKDQFAYVIRRHFEALGAPISTSSVMRIMLMLPERAMMQDQVLNILKTAVALRLAKSSAPIPNLDQLFGTRVRASSTLPKGSKPTLKTWLIDLGRVDLQTAKFLTDVFARRGVNAEEPISSSMVPLMESIIKEVEELETKAKQRELTFANCPRDASFLANGRSLCMDVDIALRKFVLFTTLKYDEMNTLILKTLNTLRYNIRLFQKRVDPNYASMSEVDVISEEEMGSISANRETDRERELIVFEQRLWLRRLMLVAVGALCILATVGIILGARLSGHTAVGCTDADFVVPGMIVTWSSDTTATVTWRRVSCDTQVESYTLLVEPADNIEQKAVPPVSVLVGGLVKDETYSFTLEASMKSGAVQRGETLSLKFSRGS